jgi:hypothetical protein
MMRFIRVNGACVNDLADAVIAKRRTIARARAIVVAISGIDGAGKGTLAAALAAALRDRGMTVEVIGADAWLNPLEQLDLGADPGGEFYRRGIRFDELLDRLDRSHDEGRSCDVILVEGIFLPVRDRAGPRAGPEPGGGAPGAASAGLSADLLPGPTIPSKARRAAGFRRNRVSQRPLAAAEPGLNPKILETWVGCAAS